MNESNFPTQHGKWDGGKGSQVRKTSNHDKFAEGWDRIFGKKKEVTEETFDKNVSNVVD